MIRKCNTLAAPDPDEIEKAIEKAKRVNKFDYQLSTIEPKSTETIVMYYNMKEISCIEIDSMTKKLMHNFPNNTVIALPDKLSLECCNKEKIEKIINSLSKIINQSDTTYTENDKGSRMVFSIEFNPEDNREYIDKVIELQDTITEVIEDKLGHTLGFSTANPLNFD